MRVTFVAVLAIGLGGCSLFRDHRAEHQQDSAFCASLGLQIGTPEYANCMLTQQARRDTSARIRAARIDATLSDMSTSIRPVTFGPVMRPMGPTVCTGMSGGNVVSVACY